MRSKNTIVGIDIGTYNIKVVITQIQSDGTPPHIIGTGSAISNGMRHGYIVSKVDVVESIKRAIDKAQKEAGVKIERAYVSIGGIGLEDKYSHGEAMVSRANSEVTEIDTENALAESEARISRELMNHKILHAIPVSYLLDGQRVLGNPIGMHGAKIEVESMFVTVLEQHLNDLVSAIEAAGVETIDIMAAPIAASLVTLTKQQKMVGCVLANIGAETVSIVVFEENTPISLKVFPTGSTDITNNIAIELRVPLSEAEQLKRGAVTGTSLPRKKLEDIVAAKTKQMFMLIQDHLKKINRAGLLPAGIILTGGGSGIADLEAYAKASLKLPSETAGLRLGEQRLKDASWAVAYGLCIWGVSSDSDTVGIENAHAAGAKFLSWFKQFLP
ncbi:cell division protein FtsA [Candidatus Kaiserbacteria bacterium]|nr:MAG: cell division protein FtsA [Candidatus Kaiserbacteria bacterium]